MNYVLKTCLTSAFLAMSFSSLHAADLKYVAPDSVVTVFVKPDLALQNPQVKKMLLGVQDMSEMKAQSGFTIEDIDEIKLQMVLTKMKIGDTEVDAPEPVKIFRMKQPASLKAMQEKTITPEYKDRTEGGVTFKFFSPFAAMNIDPNLPENIKKQMEETQRRSENRGAIVYQLDDRTALQTGSVAGLLQVPDIKQAAAAKPIWASKVSDAASKPLVVAINLKQVAQIVKANMGNRPPPQGMEGIIFSAVSVFWEKADYAVISIDTAKDVTLTATASCPTEEGAKQVSGSLDGLRRMARGFLPGLKPMVTQFDANDPAKPGEKMFTKLSQMLEQAKVTQTGTEVSLVMTLDAATLEVASTTFLKSASEARNAAKKSMSKNNLKMIALAVLTFHEANSRFPVNGPMKEGGPAVSWRVKILPFIEELQLYQQYKMDEQWDSENNKKVLAKMPTAYRNPTKDPTSTTPNYFALAGTDGILGAEGKIGFKNVRDGTSKTLLVVEAERDIPWTKPEDIEVVKGKVPELGIKGDATFNTVTSDGAVHTFSTKIDADSFWGIFTKAGGEIVDWEKLQPVPAGQFGPPPGGAQFAPPQGGGFKQPVSPPPAPVAPLR